VLVTSELPPLKRLRTADLHELGLSGRDIRRLVAEGVLLRVRMGAYVRADCDSGVLTAARIGGRLGCVSELARRGVFVHGGSDEPTGDSKAVHVQVGVNASRLGPLPKGSEVRLHWMPPVQDSDSSAAVSIVDALVQSAACQSPRAFIASVDSALQLGLLEIEDVDVVFAALPRRLRRLRGLVDGRAESGPETLVRLMLRALGGRPELQVEIAGVGRVDLVVDGWLVVECDSKAFHSSWEQQREDRRRDQVLAARGYAVYRPIAEDILYHPEDVVAALKGLLSLTRVRRA
jgi:very-short-patch-repair endonuclease